MADRFMSKLPTDDCDTEEIYDVNQADRSFLEQMLSPKVRRNFVDATRYRMNGILDEPAEGESQLEGLIRQCAWLGLDRPDMDNLLLVC